MPSLLPCVIVPPPATKITQATAALNAAFKCQQIENVACAVKNFRIAVQVQPNLATNVPAKLRGQVFNQTP